MVYISQISTPVGQWRITASEWGVTGICPSESEVLVNENEITRQASRELEEYFVHIRTEFSVPLDLTGGPAADSLRSDPQLQPGGAGHRPSHGGAGSCPGHRPQPLFGSDSLPPGAGQGRQSDRLFRRSAFEGIPPAAGGNPRIEPEWPFLSIFDKRSGKSLCRYGRQPG